MFVYWLIFLFFSSAAILNRRSEVGFSGSSTPQWSLSWLIVWILLTFIIGFRHEVGGDWNPYIWHLNAMRDKTLADTLFERDPAYAFLEWFGANVWGGIYLVNTVCAGIFSWCLLAFCRIQSRPWLAVCISTPILIIVVSMGYTRQAVAIGLVMLGFIQLQRGQVWRFILLTACASLFHTTALIFAPLAIFFLSKVKVVTLIGLTVTAGAFFTLMLQDYLALLYRDYIVAEYHSAGAIFRLATTALPAILFLIFREKFRLTVLQKKFWILMAILALSCVILFAVLPSSTAIDRFALYLVPLQIFVFSNMPDAVLRSSTGKNLLVGAVVAYSAAIQFVWLSFGAHAPEWLPYRFYPLEWLRS